MSTIAYIYIGILVLVFVVAFICVLKNNIKNNYYGYHFSYDNDGDAMLDDDKEDKILLKKQYNKKCYDTIIEVRLKYIHLLENSKSLSEARRIRKIACIELSNKLEGVYAECMKGYKPCKEFDNTHEDLEQPSFHCFSMLYGPYQCKLQESIEDFEDIFC